MKSIPEDFLSPKKTNSDLEAIKFDNYPKYVLSLDHLLQYRNGIKHVNALEFMRDGKMFD